MSNEAFRNRNVHHALRIITVLMIALLTSVVMGQSFQEYPPALPPTFNGGRVHSIAVSPTDSSHIIAAFQYGGLWQTLDGGNNWSHIRGLKAVWAVDVAYARDGRTVIATVARDLRPVNSGGIWVSRDGGLTWNKPRIGGHVPATVGGFRRTSAYGISYAPDDPNRIYVATDHGIAISVNNGATWAHQLLDAAGPGARSVQGLPGNRAIAVTRSAIYLKNDVGDSWGVIRRGSFSDGFKNIDVSPYDNDKVFILQDYNTLLLYEVAANRWTVLPLPGGTSRGPFIRAARGIDGQSIDLWAGLGHTLYKASCTDIACVRRLRCVQRPDAPADPCDWRAVTEGLHPDGGHLGLDARKRPVMHGSDGGLFKPQNPEATRWTSAAQPGSRMNSLQITSLAGTNYHPIVNPLPSLYFATQDNGIWASPDGGRTWPRAECAEGWQLQTSHVAHSTRDPSARLALGCYEGARLSDANLFNIRVTPNLDQTGRSIPGLPLNAFLLSPGMWIRFVDERYYFINRRVGSWTLYVSTDNLEHWRRVGTTSLNPSGYFRPTGPAANPTVYTTFEGARRDWHGNTSIALARLADVLRVNPGDIDESDLIYLPDYGNLGVRATEFDWQPVFGVDPRDPDFLIAPDVVNKTVWVSDSGGRRWRNDEALTERVTQGEQLLFHDGNPGQVQVTTIAFSPYERNLIMVGTREAGVVYSDDRGNSWQTIIGSEAMLYVTGFFFGSGNTVYAATYGRGLWKIDMGRRERSRLRELNICGFNYGLCSLRLPADPQQNVIRDFLRKDHNVLVVFGGRINGVIRSGEAIKSITLTKNSTYRFYSGNDQGMPEIIVSTDGAGFENDQVAEFALKNQEVITGVVFESGKPVGYLTSKEELKTDQELIAPKTGKEVSADMPGSDLPYLSISTGSLIGPGLVQAGGSVRLFGAGFIRGAPVELRLDGNTVAQIYAGSYVSYTFRVDEKLSMGQHLLEVVQKTRRGERRAIASFVKVRDGDRFGPSK